MLFRFLICLLFMISIEISAQSFGRVSKGLAILEFPGGKSGLAAITEKEARTYVITTQSLFLKFGSKFVLKDFKGHRLVSVGMSISPDTDLIKFEIETNAFIEPLKIGGEPGKIFKANPNNGIVNVKEYSEEKITEPGSVIISEDNSIAGFGSLSNGFEGKKVAFIEITGKEKWEKSTIRSFGTQISSLLEMKEKVCSIEALKKACRLNKYVEYIPSYHESHIAWVKHRNEQYEVAVFDGKSGKTSSAAKFNHESRCSIYTSMKRLSSYSNNICSIDRITKWQSKYFKELSRALAGRAAGINKKLKAEMHQMVQAYPATKAKK